MSGISNFDRMDAQIKTLQQEALATQRTLKQLHAREAPGPFAPIPQMDPAMLGAMALFCALLLVMWWYLWHRPRIRLEQQHRVPVKDLRRLSEFVGARPPDVQPRATQPPPVAMPVTPVQEPEPRLPPVRKPAPKPEPATAPLPAEIVPPLPPAASATVFARAHPGFGFDPEAAANEVTRVRKSLAEKREARSMLREYEEEGPAQPDDAPTDLGNVLDFELPEPVIFPAKPEPTVEQAHSQPSAEEADAAPLEALPWLELAPEADASREIVDVTPKPVANDPPLPLAASPVESTETWETGESHEILEPDYAVTLALAQEAVALELWAEARELADEALEYGDASVKNGARSLLQSIEVHEARKREQAQELNDTPDFTTESGSWTWSGSGSGST